MFLSTLIMGHYCAPPLHVLVIITIPPYLMSQVYLVVKLDEESELQTYPPKPLSLDKQFTLASHKIWRNGAMDKRNKKKVCD